MSSAERKSDFDCSCNLPTDLLPTIAILRCFGGAGGILTRAKVDIWLFYIFIDLTKARKYAATIFSQSAVKTRGMKLHGKCKQHLNRIVAVIIDRPGAK